MYSLCHFHYEYPDLLLTSFAMWSGIGPLDILVHIIQIIIPLYTTHNIITNQIFIYIIYTYIYIYIPLCWSNLFFLRRVCSGNPAATTAATFGLHPVRSVFFISSIRAALCFSVFRLCPVFQAGAFRFWLSGNLQKKYSIARESNAHVMHMFLSMLLFDMFDVLSILSYSLNFRHYVCVTTLRQCICWRMRTRTDPQIPQIEVKSRRSCHRFNFCYNLLFEFMCNICCAFPFSSFHPLSFFSVENSAENQESEREDRADLEVIRWSDLSSRVTECDVSMCM